LALLLRQALRRFRHRPVASVAAVLALAIGIGGASAMYSVVDATLLRPHPWPDADRLVVVHAVRPDQRLNPAWTATWDRAPLSWAAWEDLRRSPVFTDVGAWMPGQQIIRSAQPESVSAFHASSSFWTVLGVRPALGRLFVAHEDRDPSDTVVLSHEGWVRHLGARPDVIGTSVLLASGPTEPARSKEVIGVLPPAFAFQGESPEVFLPLGLMAFNGSFEANRFLRVVGRLRPGVSIVQARIVAEPLVRRDEGEETRTARVVSLSDDRAGTIARPLWLLFGGAGVLLLLACANVASLLLVDAAARRDEVSVRVALGATPRHLAIQSAVECLMVAAAASVLGVLLASLLTSILGSMAPPEILALGRPSVNPRIATLALATGMATVCLFGVGPVLTLARLTSQSPRLHGMPKVPGHRAVVVAQVALAFLLVVGAGLFGQTLAVLNATSVGFDPTGVALAQVRFVRQPVSPERSAPPIVNPATLAAFGTDRSTAMARATASWAHTTHLLDQLRRLPGVVAVAASSGAPFTGGTARVFQFREADAPSDSGINFGMRIVTEDFFSVIGLPLVAGRPFNAEDRAAGATEPVIVSRAAQSRLRSGAAVGAELSAGVGRYRIVGVVGDSLDKKASIDVRGTPTLYVLNLEAQQVSYVLVRATGDVRRLLPMLRQRLEAADPAVRVVRTAALTDLVAASLSEERFRLFISSMFGVAALVLAAVGLFGLTSDRLARRRQEIALRRALGAHASHIRYLVVHDTVIAVAVGLCAGLMASAGALRVMGSLLHGVPAVPVTIWAGGVLALVLAASAAVLLPVISAGRVDTGQILRQ
jgi:putative ABC transport system permease protein